MSKYTTELRFYLETLAGLDESTSNVASVIDSTWDKVFNFDFPIYDINYKETLCKKILLHYYTREIGSETVGLWKLRLQTKMNEIMPYYNRLYIALADEFNILYSADMMISREHADSEDSTRDFTNSSNSKTTGNDTSNTTQSGEDSNTNRFLDTPQGGLNGILDSDYLTNATIVDSTNSSKSAVENEHSTTSENSGKSKDVFDLDKSGTSFEHRYGSDDRYTAVEKYNAELFNIDMRIINELSELFMKLW